MELRWNSGGIDYPFRQKLQIRSGIDYYPTNFVGSGGLLWYVDYECNDYMPEWDFEHWGIQHWLPAVAFHPYRQEDYDAVCAFLISLNRSDKTHINWNWARFEWMMEHPEFDKSTIRSIGLWWAQDRVVRAAIYDMYFGEAFCAALPGCETIYPGILDYAHSPITVTLSGIVTLVSLSHEQNT